MLESIESVIPRSRKLVLVGHDISHDLRALKHLNFDFQTSVVGILDILWIATRALATYPRGLGDILNEFECSFYKLHCAGNDAHFTLRLLLLLAQNTTQEHAQSESRLATLREVPHFPIPYRVDPHIKAALKKQKREQRSRKHQSKFWNLEMQERIRANRAERREAAHSLLKTSLKSEKVH